MELSSQNTFCSNCGKRLTENERFCSRCGTMVENQTKGLQERQQVFASEKNADRKRALDELQRAYSWFSKKAESYDKYDRLTSRLSKMNKVGKIPMLVWGCILSALGMMLMLFVIEYRLSGFLFFSITMLLAGPALIVFFFVSESGRKRNVQKMQANLEQIGAELTEHYLAFGECSFGAEYSNPQILAKILNLVQSGRADTIKEGINIMISDLKMNEMVELSRITAQNSEIAAKNAASAARGTKASAVFSAASFFLK